METIKKVISKDGKRRLDIKLTGGGLYRYVTFDDRFRDDPDFQSQLEWAFDVYSGLYETAAAAEADATAEFGWLHDHFLLNLPDR